MKSSRYRKDRNLAAAVVSALTQLVSLTPVDYYVIVSFACVIVPNTIEIDSLLVPSS